MMFSQMRRMQSVTSLGMVSVYAYDTVWLCQGLFLAPFHDAIKDFVPEIVKLLNDPDRRVRFASARAISKLVVHGM
jgi:hypothetical protein